MNVAVKAILSVALTFLILSLIAFSFTMIKDSLPGEGRQDENYPNPLSWLTENSTIDQHPTDIPFNTTQQNQKPSNPETKVLAAPRLSIVIREETTNPLAARIYRDISQGLTAKEIANDLVNHLELVTRRDEYGRNLANLSFTSALQGVKTRICAEAEIEQLRLDVDGENELLTVTHQLTDEETAVTIPFTSIRIGNQTHSQEGDLVFTCTPLKLRQIYVHEGTASYTLQGEVRNYDTQPHNYTLTTSAGVPNTVDAFTPLPSGYVFSGTNNGLLLSLLTSSGLTQRQVTLNAPPASPRDNTVGVTNFNVTVIVSAPPLEFGQLWITLNKGPFRTVAKAPYASVETMPQITIQSFIPLEDLDYWKTATEEAVKTTTEAFPNMLKALTQETEEWAQTLTPAVAEEVKEQMEIIAQSATTQGDGRKAEAEYWQHVKTTLAASCITAADIMTAGTITGIKVAMETGSAWTGFKATFPGQLVCLIALTNDMSRPPQERARYNGRAAGIILTIIITHELAKTIKEIAPDAWSTIKQKITTLASKSKAAAKTAIQKLIDIIKRTPKDQLKQNIDTYINNLESIQPAADGGYDPAKLLAIIKEAEETAEKLWVRGDAKTKTYFVDIVTKFGERGNEAAQAILDRLTRLIEKAQTTLSPTWQGNFMETLAKEAGESLSKAETTMNIIETALREGKIPARVLSDIDEGRPLYSLRMPEEPLGAQLNKLGFEKGDILRVVIERDGTTIEAWATYGGDPASFRPHLGPEANTLSDTYALITLFEKITPERFAQLFLEKSTAAIKPRIIEGKWYAEIDSTLIEINPSELKSSGGIFYMDVQGKKFKLRFWKGGEVGLELGGQMRKIAEAEFVPEKQVIRFKYYTSLLGAETYTHSVYLSEFVQTTKWDLGLTRYLEGHYSPDEIAESLINKIEEGIPDEGVSGLNVKSVSLAEKITGQLTESTFDDLRDARNAANSFREGEMALEILTNILEKDRELSVHRIRPEQGAGDLLGDVRGVNRAYEVVMRTSIKDILEGTGRIAKSILKHHTELATWGVDGKIYKEIFAAIAFFDRESPYFDYLIFEVVIEG